VSASMDSTDALFAENVEQKMSNPLAHFLAARSFLDRLTKLIRRRKIPDFSRRFESDQPPVIGFEPRCVEPVRRAPWLVNAASGNDQPSLEEKIILLGRQDGLRRC